MTILMFCGDLNSSPLKTLLPFKSILLLKHGLSQTSECRKESQSFFIIRFSLLFTSSNID